MYQDAEDLFVSDFDVEADTLMTLLTYRLGLVIMIVTKKTRPKSFRPWSGSLFIRISSESLLFSSPCFKGSKSFFFKLETTLYFVQDTFIFQKFEMKTNWIFCFPRSTTYEADVGLLELAQTIRFDKYKQPAALVRPDVALTGMAFNVTGWGVVQEKGHYAQKLLQTEVPYVAFDKCRDAYHSLSIAPKIRPGMICAGITT